MTHEEWLAERKKSIGGSDAAAVLGLNPYSSPFALWADKTGRLPEKEDNEAMRQGRDLEAYVAGRFCEKTGLKCRRKRDFLRNPNYPFAHANVDRLVVGESAGLECKTTSMLNLRRFKNGDYPESYYCQCVHYMAVTGAARWYLAVLVLNQGFYVYTIERDEGEIDSLMEAERKFWEYVQSDTPPPLDGLEVTSKTQEFLYRRSIPEGKPIYRFDIVQNYLDLKSQINALEREKERCAQILKQELGEYESGECGMFKIFWKAQERLVFDAKRYAQEHPKADLSDYYNTTRFRKFEVKERKTP